MTPPKYYSKLPINSDATTNAAFYTGVSTNNLYKREDKFRKFKNNSTAASSNSTTNSSSPRSDSDGTRKILKSVGRLWDCEKTIVDLEQILTGSKSFVDCGVRVDSDMGGLKKKLNIAREFSFPKKNNETCADRINKFCCSLNSKFGNTSEDEFRKTYGIFWFLYSFF